MSAADVHGTEGEENEKRQNEKHLRKRCVDVDGACPPEDAEKGSRYGRRRRHRGSVYGGIYRIGGSCSFDLREFSHVEEEKQYRKIAENVEKIYREKSRQLAPEKLEKVYERRVLKNAELILFDALSVGKRTVEYVESFLFRFIFGFILKIVPVESVHF